MLGATKLDQMETELNQANMEFEQLYKQSQKFSAEERAKFLEAVAVIDSQRRQATQFLRLIRGGKSKEKPDKKEFPGEEQVLKAWKKCQEGLRSLGFFYVL